MNPSERPDNSLIGATGVDAHSRSYYLPQLDGLRFIAFLLVFVHHLPASGIGWIDFIKDQGWVGVHVFLVLSAYLLTVILLKEQRSRGRISVRSFYIRRILRIWPLYLGFTIAATIALAKEMGGPQEPLNGMLGIRFLGLAAFFDNFVTGILGYNPIRFTAHLWTISLEEQFYLFLPLLLALASHGRRRLFRALALCWLICAAGRFAAVLHYAPHPLIWTSPLSGDSLLFGTALGIIDYQVKTRFAQWSLLLIGAGALCLPGLLPPPSTVGFHQVFEYTLVGAGCGAILLASTGAQPLSPLATSPLRYLGKISFGLYVFHLLGIHLGTSIVRSLSVGESWEAIAFASLLVTGTMAAASYELFEKHFLKLKARFQAFATRPA